MTKFTVNTLPRLCFNSNKLMIETMKNAFSTLKLLLTVCLIPVALVCRADESLNYARVFEALCVASKLEAQQISAVLNLQEKHKFVEKADLALSSPDADAGAVFLNTGTVYFVTYGQRSSSFGGAFCSVGTEGFLSWPPKTVPLFVD